MEQDNFKSGFVAVMGRPNVGKSTLINTLIGSKVSIVSRIPQTTRHQVRGILNLDSAQIVFVDTPGIHSFKDALVTHLNTIAKKSLEGCDLVVYMADISRNIGVEERRVMEILCSQNIKVIMALNKIDLGTKFINSYIDSWKNMIEKKAIKNDPLIYFLPLSAKNQKNLDKLVEAIVENLPVQHPFYDTKTVTDFPLKFRIADIVREKLFTILKKELPHSVAVEIEDIEDRGDLSYIRVNIYVDRSTKRKIIIGEGGQTIKKVGTDARAEIEKIFNKQVYLDIWVKVLAGWQEKPRILKELGYWWA